MNKIRKSTRKTVLVLLVISFLVVRCTQRTKLYYTKPGATIPPWFSSVDLNKLGSSFWLFFYEWICSIALKLFSCLKYSVLNLRFCKVVSKTWFFSCQNLLRTFCHYCFLCKSSYIILWRIYGLKNRNLSAVSPSLPPPILPSCHPSSIPHDTTFTRPCSTVPCNI